MTKLTRDARSFGHDADKLAKAAEHVEIDEKQLEEDLLKGYHLLLENIDQHFTEKKKIEENMEDLAYVFHTIGRHLPELRVGTDKLVHSLNELTKAYKSGSFRSKQEFSEAIHDSMQLGTSIRQVMQGNVQMLDALRRRVA